MTYARTNHDFQNALAAYAPAADEAAAINAAKARTSVVDQAVAVFGALGAAPALDQAGLALLLGAAHLIQESNWHDMASAAGELITARAGELLPAPPPPIAPTPA